MGKMNTGLKRCAGYGLVFAVCAVLAGCASDGGQSDKQSVKAETQKPVSIDIVPQYDTDPTKAIDTSHLPKKTIQTPWGPREIPDQSKNPELRKALETIQRTKNDESHRALYKDMLRKVSIIRSIQRNDLLRLGCAELRDSTCAFNFYLYSNDCKSAHNIGLTILSRCEQTSFKNIQRPMIGYMSCELEGKYIEPLEIFSKETIDEQVELFLAHECKIWRGEKDWDKAYLASQPVDNPKQKE